MSIYAIDHHHNAEEASVFGFWIYVMSDCILFATLFAAYIVMHDNTFGGPGLRDIINLPYVLGETFFLLISNFTFGLAILALYKNKTSHVITWLAITFLLGLGFVGMEVNEFYQLYAEGHSWQSSGALSSFFALVGTHGFHVTMGLLWILTMTVQISRFNLTPTIKKRLVYLGLFWNFLDIVWIFVFTIVYLMGAI